MFFCFYLTIQLAISQEKQTEWYITANANLYYPIQTPSKGVYPILWYDRETDPNILIGGFGIGGAVYHPLTEKILLKGQLNLSKHSYWNETVSIVDESGGLYYSYQPSTADYMAGISATANYFFIPKLGIGTGLGAQYLLASLTRQPKEFGDLSRNRFYVPLVVTLPIEATLKLSKTLFLVRYEHSLTNRLHAESNFKDRFGLVYFEVGFKIK